MNIIQNTNTENESDQRLKIIYFSTEEKEIYEKYLPKINALEIWEASECLETLRQAVNALYSNFYYTCNSLPMRIFLLNEKIIDSVPLFDAICNMPFNNCTTSYAMDDKPINKNETAWHQWRNRYRYTLNQSVMSEFPNLFTYFLDEYMHLKSVAIRHEKEMEDFKKKYIEVFPDGVMRVKDEFVKRDKSGNGFIIVG